MKRRTLLFLFLVCLPHFAAAAEDGGTNCSRLLNAPIAPATINKFIDAFDLADDETHSAGYGMPIQAIQLDTEYGVGTHIFYPFGGIDVVTAANSPSVQTIYSAQLEPFGDIAVGLQVLGHSSSTGELARLTETFFHAITLGWISSSTLTRASELTHGLGIHALLVIRKLMGAKILDVGYLVFENGVWRGRPLTDPPENPDHGYVEFEYRGRTIKYFLIRADLEEIDPNELRSLLNGKKFDSILRHIHGAKGRLKSDFSRLLSVLNESERIFTTGPEEEPYSSFPGYNVVWEHDRTSNWAPYFGIHGPMAILLRRSDKN